MLSICLTCWKLWLKKSHFSHPCYILFKNTITLMPLPKMEGQSKWNPEDLKNALNTLKRQPKSTEELAKLIRHQRHALLQQDLEEAEQNFLLSKKNKE